MLLTMRNEQDFADRVRQSDLPPEGKKVATAAFKELLKDFGDILDF